MYLVIESVDAVEGLLFYHRGEFLEQRSDGRKLFCGSKRAAIGSGSYFGDFKLTKDRPCFIENFPFSS